MKRGVANVLMNIVMTVAVVMACVVALTLITEACSEARFIVGTLFALIIIEFEWDIWKDLGR